MTEKYETCINCPTDDSRYNWEEAGFQCETESDFLEWLRENAAEGEEYLLTETEMDFTGGYVYRIEGNEIIVTDSTSSMDTPPVIARHSM